MRGNDREWESRRRSMKFSSFVDESAILREEVVELSFRQMRLNTDLTDSAPILAQMHLVTYPVTSMRHVVKFEIVGGEIDSSWRKVS